jgi:hypothetical protein
VANAALFVRSLADATPGAEAGSGGWPYCGVVRRSSPHRVFREDRHLRHDRHRALFGMQRDANCSEAAPEPMTVGMTQTPRSMTQTVTGC